MKTTIFQIEQSYNQLAEELIDNGGELTPLLEEQLAITEEQLQNKSVAYSFVIKQMDADVDTIDAEIKRLQDIKLDLRVLAAKDDMKGKLTPKVSPVTNEANN